jgi:hypothetical protein
MNIQHSTTKCMASVTSLCFINIKDFAFLLRKRTAFSRFMGAKEDDQDLEFSDSDSAPAAASTGPEASVADDIPREQRHLRTQAYDKSIADVIGMMDTGDIVLDPEYQRNYVWDNKKASLLIESILLNVPIPVIYVAEDPDSKWNVVDGLQRLFSIKRFFKDDFKLRGLEVLTELNGLTYSSLNPKASRILRNGILRIILIFKESHPEIKYEIFMRLNRGAIKLKEQELRNCLYRGKLNSLLKELKGNRVFLEILGLKQPHKRMDDEELILRYLAISESYDPDSGEVKNYTGKIKGTLNKFMEANRQVEDAKLDTFRRRFIDSIDKAYAVFGSNAFRRVTPDRTFEKRPNRAIMDVILTSFTRWPREALELKKEDIVNLLQSLAANDPEFNNSITIATSDKKHLEYRLEKWNAELSKIIHESPVRSL